MIVRPPVPDILAHWAGAAVPPVSSSQRNSTYPNDRFGRDSETLYGGVDQYGLGTQWPF